MDHSPDGWCMDGLGGRAVGYQNPPIWSELEPLSDQSRPGSHGRQPIEAEVLSGPSG
jgi:hypothetical protein